MKDVVKVVVSSLLLVALLLIAPIFTHWGHRFYLIERTKQSVVKLMGRQGMGTAWQVNTPSGKQLLVSNHHVCRLADSRGKIRAVGQTRQQTVTVLWKADFTDLCVLTPVKGMPGLSLSKIDVYANQKIMAVGHPMNMDVTATEGSVIDYRRSSILLGIVGMDLKEEDCKGPMFTQIPLSLEMLFMKNHSDREYKHLPYYLTDENKEVDAPPVPRPTLKGCIMTFTAMDTNIQVMGGNSGSPVVDMSGNVVGVVFAQFGTASWGALVPLESIERLIKKR